LKIVAALVHKSVAAMACNWYISFSALFFLFDVAMHFLASPNFIVILSNCMCSLFLCDWSLSYFGLDIICLFLSRKLCCSLPCYW